MISQKAFNFCFCRYCLRQGRSPICDKCLDDIPQVNYPCYSCYTPLLENGYCPSCIKIPKTYDYIIAAGPYESLLKDMIKNIKFKNALSLMPPLVKLLLKKVDAFYQHTEKPKAIIPVPLHPKRLKSRGYNQAFELCKQLNKKHPSPILVHACQRLKNTEPQSQLSLKERKINTKNAFQASSIPYSHIALIDDVVTSGATIEALCHALKKKNPSLRIDIWCLAKAHIDVAH